MRICSLLSKGVRSIWIPVPRGRRTLVLAAAAFLTLPLGLGLANATAASASTCWNYSCDGQMPNNQGCDLYSGVVDTVYETWGRTDLYWSSSCDANWAKSLSGIGVPIPMMARVERDNGDWFESVWTGMEVTSPMLGGMTNFNRACGRVPNWDIDRCTDWH